MEILFKMLIARTDYYVWFCLSIALTIGMSRFAWVVFTALANKIIKNDKK